MSTANAPGEHPVASYPHPGYGHGYGHPPPGHHPPPAYFPPPGYPLAGYRRPTNSMAILALVLALAFAPAGLIVGIIARRQIRQTGEEGAGMALAGIVVGGIGTAVFALLLVVWAIAVMMLISG